MAKTYRRHRQQIKYQLIQRLRYFDQMHHSCSHACLTGAIIQDWSISTDTQLSAVKCEYIYMQLPTKIDPDPCRKPDNRNEVFQEGDFADSALVTYNRHPAKASAD